MITRVVSGVVAVFCLAHGAPGQEAQNTMAELERLAVKAALEGPGEIKPNSRIVIDPMIVRANEAPGGRDSTLREAGRNAKLAQAVGGRAIARNSAMDCSTRPCKLRDADVIVMLSNPALAGEEAQVTVTTLRQASNRMHYRTVNVRLAKKDGAWRVVGLVELGVS
jgi:hypothetical protein